MPSCRGKRAHLAVGEHGLGRLALDLLVRRLIAVVQIYGGGSGIVLVLRAVLGGRYSAPELVLSLVLLGLFLLGLIAGVRLLERSGGMRASIWFQALQIPGLVSPVLVYDLTAGMDLSVHLGRAIGFDYGLGTDWRFELFPPNQPWRLSVNLLALFAVLYLRVSSRQRF